MEDVPQSFLCLRDIVALHCLNYLAAIPLSARFFSDFFCTEKISP